MATGSGQCGGWLGAVILARLTHGRGGLVLFIRRAGIIDRVALSSKRLGSYLAAHFTHLVDGGQCIYRVYGTGDTGVY